MIQYKKRESSTPFSPLHLHKRVESDIYVDVGFCLPICEIEVITIGLKIVYACATHMIRTYVRFMILCHFERVSGKEMKKYIIFSTE